jgi:protease IV
MRRFIVGLLATVGALTLLCGGVAAYVTLSGMFAARPLPKEIVLSLDLRRLPSETPSGDLLAGLWRNPRDMTETLQLLWRAADDSRVKGLYVEIGDEEGGLARVQELREAIAHFRSKGKFAVGFAETLASGGSHFADYYLATALDEIWLQPSGSFGVVGMAIETPFARDGLQRLGVRIEGGKRHEYKSAPDTFTEQGYTGPARENLQQLVNSLFGQFVADAARDRKIEADQLRRLIDRAPLDPDQAMAEKLIDNVGYRTDALESVWTRAGTVKELVPLDEYAGEEPRRRADDPVVALVHINGDIVSGSNEDSPLDNEANAASDDIVDALEAASQSKSVKAIILRIDSPGGTYPAADAIADGVARARSTGKPVIVSMGDVAASGGYLAAVRADKIVAEPTTITASIGVFGLWPVATDLLNSLGIRFERVKVGSNAGMYSTFIPPTPAERAIVSRDLDTVYSSFTRQVGDARNLDRAAVDRAARGRVLSGSDAKAAGLVDELGGLRTAIGLARSAAGIEAGRKVELQRFPLEEGRWTRIVGRLLRLSGIDARGPQIRAPRQVREAIARLGFAVRPGNVRLPPLPPLWH